jgi:hypothetical protein
MTSDVLATFGIRLRNRCATGSDSATERDSRVKAPVGWALLDLIDDWENRKVWRAGKRTEELGRAKGGAHSVSDVTEVILMIATNRRTETIGRRIHGEMAGLIPA